MCTTTVWVTKESVSIKDMSLTSLFQGFNMQFKKNTFCSSNWNRPYSYFILSNLFLRQKCRENRDLPFTGSFLKCLQPLGWARLKSGNWNSVWVSNLSSRDPITWTITHYLLGCVLAGSWNESRARTQTQVFWEMWVSQVGILTISLNPIPQYAYFNELQNDNVAVGYKTKSNVT